MVSRRCGRKDKHPSISATHRAHLRAVPLADEMEAQIHAGHRAGGCVYLIGVDEQRRGVDVDSGVTTSVRLSVSPVRRPLPVQCRFELLMPPAPSRTRWIRPCAA